MRRVNRSAIVPYTADAMFALVNDIASYPRFLPWCRNAKVLESSPRQVTASLELSRGGVHKWFTTLNHLEPGRRIDMTLLDGPFKHLEGHWLFEPMGDAGCKASLSMAFEFSNPLLDMMFGPVFHQICNSLLDAFAQRAHDLHDR